MPETKHLPLAQAPAAPLLAAMEAFVHSGRVRACVPGHGGGPFVPPLLAAAISRESVAALDVTELPGLDDLAHPEGVMADAEGRMARALGAVGAAFLVNGSTVGIQAVLLATAEEGATVAFPAGSHRSVYAAAALAGLMPLLIRDRVDPGTGASLGPDPRDLDRIERARPGTLCLPYPTYQGVAWDVTPWARLAHRIGATIWLDSAHGSHFGLDPRLPTPALATGVDGAVLGFHKSMGSLTQTAVLAWRDEEFGDRLRAALRLLQTSSPSYVLLASLDAARASMDDPKDSRMRWREAVDRSLVLRERWGDAVWVPEESGIRMDPTRITLKPPPGRSGFELAHALWERGIAAEYADGLGVLLILGPGVGREGGRRVEEEMRVLKHTWPATDHGSAAGPVRERPVWDPDGRQFAMPMLRALRRPSRWVNLEHAVGALSGDFVVPYPPGIPWILPGERVRPDVIARLQGRLKQGAEVQGITKQGTMKVIQDEAPDMGSKPEVLA